MNRNFVHGVVLSLMLLVFTGCALSRTAETEKMHTLSSALTKLSASVEATVRYEDPPEGIDDAELLALATKHDPGLMALFADYVVKVLRQDNHAIVLICDKNGHIGLIEDAGCSSMLDRQLWKSIPAKPCEFTLRGSDVCTADQNEGETLPGKSSLFP